MQLKLQDRFKVICSLALSKSSKHASGVLFFVVTKRVIFLANVWDDAGCHNELSW